MVNIRLKFDDRSNYLPDFNSLGINDKENATNFINDSISGAKIILTLRAINKSKMYKGEYYFRARHFLRYNDNDIFHIDITVISEQISIQKKQTNTKAQIKSINTTGIIDDLPYECQSCNEDDDKSEKFKNRRNSF
jgi:hypothetical protein